MVQPRKEQIKSVNTKFTFGDIILYPGSSDTIIPIETYAITGVPGGAEEDVQASTVSSIYSPYPILAGDAIKIAIDGAPSVSVTFTGTDTTVSRIASRINTTLGFDVAFNQEGLLFLQTPTVGASSSIVLSDVSPGVLTKLGLAAGTYTGLKGPVKGILTRTPDGLGGLVRLATQDGRHLVTDVTDYRMVGNNAGSAIWTASILGGTPIHGRLTYDGYKYHIRSYAKLPTKASAITFNSSFTTLGGSDQVDLTVDGISFSVSFGFFGSNPNNRDWVVQLINSAYAGVLGFYGGHVYIVGTVSGPFSFSSSDSFTIKVDGGSQTIVVFTGTEVTASDVANVINTAVGSSVATNYFNGYQDLVYLLSPNNNGVNSSIELVDNSLSSGTLSKIGLRPGMYRGPFIAEPYGPDEIKITSQYRGTGVLLQIGGLPATLTKLGLNAGTYGGSDSSEEELVKIPYQQAFNINGYPVEMIFSEVMEFGDIDPVGDSRVQKFLDKSAGSNQSVSSLNLKFVNTPFGNTYVSPSRGLFDVGKPVTVGPDGSVAREYLQDAIDQSNAFFKQFLRYPGGVVSAIVSNRFEGTGFGGNALSSAGFMEFYLDPTNSYPYYAEYDFLANTGIYNYDNLIASITRDAGTSASFGPNTPGYIALFNGCGVVSWDTTSGPLGTSDGLKFADVHTHNRVTGGGTGQGYIPLTADPNHIDGSPTLADNYVRNVVEAGPYSIMRTLNARHEIVLGDGVSSFGDFSGPDAFHKAQAYLNVVGAKRATIRVKHGYYVTSFTVDFTFLSDLVIDGYYEHPSASSVSISHQWYYESFSLPNNGYTKISGIAITNDIGAELNLIRVEGGILELDGCWINAGGVYCTNIVEFRAYKTDFIGQSMPILSPGPWFQAVGFDIWANDSHYQNTNIISFKECYLSSPVNGAVVAVYDYTSMGTANVELIEFLNCNFDTSRVAIDESGNLLSQCGIISFNPSSDVYANCGGEIKNVHIYDCRLNTSDYGSGSPVAIHVMPSGWDGSSYYTQGSGYPAMKIDNFDIKRFYVGFWNTHDAVAIPAIAIGGIGVDSDYGSKLTIEDVVVDAWFSTNGSSTNNMIPWFTNYTGGLYGDFGEAKGGFFCLAAKHIEVKNIEFVHPIAWANYGEFFFCSYGQLDIEGVDVPLKLGGGGYTPPSSRLCIREMFQQLNSFNMKRIYYYNTDGADQWVRGAIVWIEARNYLISKGHINDLNIELYASPASFVNGISMPKTGAYYGAYGGNTGGVIIENSSIGSRFIGSLSENGLLFGIEAYADDITIRNVMIDSCQYNGIFVDSYLSRSVKIEDCTVIYCGNSASSGDYSVGVCLLSRRSNDAFGSFDVINNYIGLNHASPDSYQLNVRDVDPWGAKTTGVVTGNSTIYSGDYYGVFNITLNVDTAIPAGFLYNGTVRVLGVETGYSGSTGSFVGPGAGLIYVPDFFPYILMSMIHNRALLLSNLSLLY
jgi:hypothetical protein